MYSWFMCVLKENKYFADSEIVFHFRCVFRKIILYLIVMFYPTRFEIAIDMMNEKLGLENRF